MVKYIYFYNLLVLTILARGEIHSLNAATLKKYGCHVMHYRSGVMRKRFIDCTVRYCFEVLVYTF